MKIIGQKIILHYLNEGLLKNRLSHSLLFIGKEGVGKKTVAMELAKSISCEARRDSIIENQLLNCDECDSCLKIRKNSSPDLLLLNKEFQADLLGEKPESQAAIKIESIRHLDHFLHLRSLQGKSRIVIIDDAHKLTNEASNALLKLLEEPPSNTQLVLLAYDEHSMPSTIASRCAVLRFSPISNEEMTGWLEKNEGFSAQVAQEIAQRSGGSFAQALKAKDEELIEDISNQDREELFNYLDQPSFKREGRKQAERILLSLLNYAQKEMHQGNLSQRELVESILSARKQIDRYVSPRLVLENLFIKMTA